MQLGTHNDARPLACPGGAPFPPARLICEKGSFHRFRSCPIPFEKLRFTRHAFPVQGIANARRRRPDFFCGRDGYLYYGAIGAMATRPELWESLARDATTRSLKTWRG